MPAAGAAEAALPVWVPGLLVGLLILLDLVLMALIVSIIRARRKA